jgi:hypothetical protein
MRLLWDMAITALVVLTSFAVPVQVAFDGDGPARNL